MARMTWAKASFQFASIRSEKKATAWSIVPWSSNGSYQQE